MIFKVTRGDLEDDPRRSSRSLATILKMTRDDLNVIGDDPEGDLR